MAAARVTLAKFRRGRGRTCNAPRRSTASCSPRAQTTLAHDLRHGLGLPTSRDRSTSSRLSSPGNREASNRGACNREDAVDTERLPHWPVELLAISLPSAPPSSAFSRHPHPRFAQLTRSEHTRLEAKLLQTHCRHMQQHDHLTLLQEEMGPSGMQQLFRESKETLEIGALRQTIQKAPLTRSHMEVKLLFEYIQQRDFFKDLSTVMVRELLDEFSHRRYDEGDTLHVTGDEADGVLVLLRGQVVLISAGSTREVSRGNVLGLSELLDDNRAVFKVRDDPVRLHTAVAGRRGAEIIFLPAEVLVSLLHTEALREKVWVLQELFPTTKGKRREDLLVPSRLERGGQRPTIVDLFEVGEVQRHHVFFNQGEQVSNGRITVVIDGKVTMRAKGLVMHELSTGAILGEEAWLGKPYQTTASCISAKARIMSISVADYVGQFHSHGRVMQREQEELNRMHAAKSKQITLKRSQAGKTQRFTSNRAGADDTDEDDAVVSAHLGRSASHHARIKKIVRTLQKPTTLQADCEGLLESDWKLLKPKELPKRIAPREPKPPPPRGCSAVEEADWELGETPRYLLGGARLRPPTDSAAKGWEHVETAPGVSDAKKSSKGFTRPASNDAATVSNRRWVLASRGRSPPRSREASGQPCLPELEKRPTPPNPTRLRAYRAPAKRLCVLKALKTQ